jgi:methylmalonyl-CoA mutase N-terminal domain/subunit
MTDDPGRELEQAYFESAPQGLTWSGLPCKEAYRAEDLAEGASAGDPAAPGEYPYTRGIHRNMYRGRLWTRREVCGFGSGRDTNARMRFQLAAGVSGLSVIDDNNGSLGIDADHPAGIADAGVQGVSVSSLADFEDLFDGVPIERVSVSFDISGLDSLAWMALYVALAEKRGVDPALLRGTVQNDTLHFQFCGYGDSCPVDLGLKASVDIIEYCTRRMPRWYTGNVNFYDMREQGLDAPQELAFGFGNAIEYTERALARGLRVDDFAPRRAFYCSSHIDFFEEIAKLRAARRMWARIMREQFGAKDPRAWQFRFGVHTAGVSLVASEPLNNAIRVAYEALAAVLAGAQSIHCCSYDEPIGLPTETSQKLAIRTQQILAYETGVTRVADPLGGSYYVESLTGQIEREALRRLDEIRAQGGMAAAISSGWVLRQIEAASLKRQEELEAGSKIVVGVNAFRPERDSHTPGGVHVVPPGQGEQLAQAVRSLRAARDGGAVGQALRALRERARSGEGENLLPAMIGAARVYATVGEMLGTVREEYGLRWDPLGMLEAPRGLAA